MLRLLDANANRAREALRVLEDYARFILDAPDLCLALKTLRHDLTAVLSPLACHAILHRDTPNDVGTHTKVPPELSRTGIADVITAASKRLGEALRTLEEFSKTTDPSIAAKIETIRYKAYDIVGRLSRTLGRGERFQNVRLCVLITESLCKIPWLTAAKSAIAGGADCIQLREKGLDDADLLRRAVSLVALCHQANILCIINDRPDIALLANADGVHVGQSDLPATAVRKLLGPDLVVGVSTHNLDQARQALLDGADYIGIGPIFPSKTKPRDFIAGLDTARQIAANIKIPTLAIAGITPKNVDDVLATGIKAIAVSSAVLDDKDITAATARLASAVKQNPKDKDVHSRNP
jgi:thiamine-phosphate pyrophosphorylase